MQEEREPAPLVLFGGDQLLGETRPVGLANLRFVEQARVLRRARREVCEHSGPNDVPAVERAVARETERCDLLSVNA